MKAIASIDEEYGIGKDGRLLVRNKEDMKFFKETTMGHIIVMGRTTFESIGKPLPYRVNVVITHQDIKIPGVIVKNDWREVLNWEDTFVIGGAQIYELFLPYYDEIYLTENDGIYGADAFFPKFNKEEYDMIQLFAGETYRINKYTKRA